MQINYKIIGYASQKSLKESESRLADPREEKSFLWFAGTKGRLWREDFNLPICVMEVTEAADSNVISELVTEETP